MEVFPLTRPSVQSVIVLAKIQDHLQHARGRLRDAASGLKTGFVHLAAALRKCFKNHSSLTQQSTTPGNLKANRDFDRNAFAPKGLRSGRDEELQEGPLADDVRAIPSSMRMGTPGLDVQRRWSGSVKFGSRGLIIR